MLASATALLMDSWLWLAGAAVIGFWLLGAYNRLVRLRASVVATFPSLEVQLRKRHSLVQGLLAALVEPTPNAQFAAEEMRDADPQAPVVARATPTDPTSTVLETVGEAMRVAAQALDRMGRRTIVGGGWSNLPAVEVAERGVDIAVESLVSRLQLGALEAPLVPAVAESLDRLQRVRKPIAYCMEVYNAAAEHHNAALRVFPTSLAARLFQFRPATLLNLQQAQPAAQPLPDSEPG